MLAESLFIISAYCPGKACGAIGKITSSGRLAIEGKTIACGNNLPIESKVFISGIGYRICEDRGSAIGEDKIDLFFEKIEDAKKFGVQNRKVKIIWTPGMLPIWRNYGEE